MVNSAKKIFYAPKSIDLNNITSFIRVFNFIFNLTQKQRPDYPLSFGKVQKCDATGVLLLYKILEYSVINNCFRDPTHDINNNLYLKGCISEYGFSELVKALMKDPDDIDLKPYKNLKVLHDKKVLVAPIALIRRETYHSEEIIKNHYVPTISSFYTDEKIQNMILGVFTEIMHNFWAHATLDSNSIIFGYGTLNYFAIICCDNGKGIDGTMRERFRSMDSKKLVLQAMKDGITSKENTSHMGYGLWYVNEVISQIKGTLTIISNNILYTNSYGRQNIMNCPAWKGCVISLKMPLNAPVTICDIKQIQNSNVKINFI